MKLTARSAAVYSVTFAGLLALSACGKNDQSANQPASPSTAPAPAAPSTAAKPAPASTAMAPAAAHTAATPAAPTPATTTAAVAAPAAAVAGFQVATVTLGDTVGPDHKVRKELTSFSPSQKTIYVSVETTGTSTGATLSAKWSYLEGAGQPVTTTSQSIAPDGAATTTFRVVNPNLWPAGKYKVDISLDGKAVASKNFDITKS